MDGWKEVKEGRMDKGIDEGCFIGQMDKWRIGWVDR